MEKEQINTLNKKTKKGYVLICTNESPKTYEMRPIDSIIFENGTTLKSLKEEVLELRFTLDNLEKAFNELVKELSQR